MPCQTWQQHRNSSRSHKLVVPLGVREFASNDRRVFLEVVVRFSWTNSHRNEVELVMPGRTTAGYLLGDSCVAKPYVLGKPIYVWWQLYSAVLQFHVFWLSEMTSATFCESSPTVQSRLQSQVQSTEYRRPPKSVFWGILAEMNVHIPLSCLATLQRPDCTRTVIASQSSPATIVKLSLHMQGLFPVAPSSAATVHSVFSSPPLVD